MNAADTAKYTAWLKAHLSVMDAFAQGEEIQFRDSQSVSGWIDTDVPQWCLDNHYRVKPKPRKVVVIEYSSDGGQWKVWNTIHYGDSERVKGSVLHARASHAHVRAVEFLEVMENEPR